MPENIDSWLAEHRIESVRIEGTNLEGAFIGKNVSPRKFASGLRSGFAFADVAFGLDLGNAPQFGFAMPSWRGDLADIFLHADLSTLVEWSPGRASVIGGFWAPDGDPVSACPRNALQRMTKLLADRGYDAKVAVEIEATVFEESIQEARSKGYRDLTPLGGNAGSAYHLAKSKDWEDYMLAVARRLEELHIPWEAWGDEAASGQIEFNVAPADPVTAADYWARTRQVMREVAFEQGRCVTFMAKWCDEYGQASHINVSLERDGENAFYDEFGPSQVMTHFLGGVMATLAPATSFALPAITSYRRLQELEGPPTTVAWGVANKSTAVRAVVGHPKYSRLEYRTPGADANIYLVLAAVLAGGVAGLDGKIEPPEPFDDMAWCLPPGMPKIPNTISKAAEALRADTLLTGVLGQELVDYWLGTRRWEWLQFHTTGGDPDTGLTEWESNRYFELP
ncbi:glutamine synthetase [Streptomyces sp. NBC_00988]|uniref:glutamine synthetase family protein n=1 Tax=Streptomyces sp. NBC_00988 TaxID=2903704 RepID=UPI0038688102|nr:glutamine synthetase [Streptomyces sp. NBC_00988]